MRHTTLLFVISISDSLLFFFFFFNDTATTEIYTLSLHDALPIFIQWLAGNLLDSALQVHEAFSGIAEALPWREADCERVAVAPPVGKAGAMTQHEASGKIGRASCRERV